jgi:hypothetical protein
METQTGVNDMTITAAHRRIIKDRAETRDCKYRITSNGEVHFYGRMPNSIEIGWWVFANSISDAINCAG